MRSAVLWLVFLLAFLVQAQPPPSLASLQAQLEALKAQLPPTCNGSSFLQRNSTGWFCVTPVRQSGNSSGWCRASQDGSETITCDASPSLLGSPPDCRPPGGKWLGFNATLGGWICVCNAGWSGTSCNISTGVQEIACSAPPVCVAAGWTGFYLYLNGTMVCQCLQGWVGINCSQQGNTTSPQPIAPPSPALAPGGGGLQAGSYSGLVNVALGGVAALSSTLNSPSTLFAASNAVDNVTTCNDDAEAPTLARADWQSLRWWSVDLQYTADVQKITIFGRACCVLQSGTPTNTVQSDQLDVYVGNYGAVGGSNILCASNVTAPVTGVDVLCAGGVQGRYVFVVKRGGTGTGLSPGDYLSLCEVQVWAAPNSVSSTVPPSPALAPGGVTPSPPPPSPSPASTFLCTQQDIVCSVLGDLYYATDGAGWQTRTGWASASAGTATDYCTFLGTYCNDGTLVSMCVTRCCRVPLHGAEVPRLCVHAAL